jgi:predicted O-methyltransferase YrrM
MAGRSPLLPEKVSRYIEEHAVREAPVLRELRKATAPVKWSGMQIGADQGNLMALLVKLMGAKRCLEIGTYTGYSALAVALALPKDGKIVCCDISEEFTSVGKPFWKRGEGREEDDLRIGPALQGNDGCSARKKENSTSSSSTPTRGNYLNYYERCLKLVRRGRPDRRRQRSMVGRSGERRRRTT